MAKGIDIYRKFQTVTNWQSVKNSGVTYVYVKLSDGGGMPAVGRGDAEVNGAKSVGIPVGGYHFVQANPGPVAQADILLGEVRRLGATGCAPMLDLEDNPAGSSQPNIPDSQKSAFGKAFCNRVAAQGFRPGVYMNNALAKQLRPDNWGVPGLVIWIARYGAKPDAAAGRYDIHQYSSTGSVPGISAGGIDMDESYTDNHLLAPTEDDLTPDQAAQLASIKAVTDLLKMQQARFKGDQPNGEMKTDGWYGDFAEVARMNLKIANDLTAKVNGLATPAVDIQALAAAVAPLVSAAVGDAVAQAVAAELAKRLEA